MIYLHGIFQQEYIQSIIHNTSFANEVNNIMLKNNCRQYIPDRLNYMTSDSELGKILKQKSVIRTDDNEDLAKPGFHIMTRWENQLYNKYIKDSSPNNKYFIINTVNFEAFNVIEGMACRNDERVTMFTSIEEDLPNRIFDIGLNMRVFVYRHKCMEHLFGNEIF